MIVACSRQNSHLPNVKLLCKPGNVQRISYSSSPKRLIPAASLSDTAASLTVRAMGKGKKFGIGKGGGGEKKQSSRPTHFLCFPLARNSTVPTFAKSIDYFRDVSLEPRRPHQLRGLDDNQEVSADSTSKDEQKAIDEADPLGNVARARAAQPSFEDSLKVLPSIVYRGPGTLHLTLGVMDLSDPAEMEKATQLLQSLDLQKMLREAAQGPPAGMKAARKWEAKDKPSTSSERINSDAAESSSTMVGSLSKPVSPPLVLRPHDDEQNSQLKPLNISLTGISAFASAKRARVIWAKPRAQASTNTDTISSSAESQSALRPSFSQTEQDRLYNFGLHVHYAFKTAGLINETRPIVLHATIANMRYKMQAKGGRTTKGRAWAHGKKRWEDGLVDVRDLVKVFNDFDGDVQKAKVALSSHADGENTGDDVESNQNEQEEPLEQEDQGEVDDRDRESSDPDKEFIWCSDIAVDRVAICKMGATKLEDPLWVESYPPISEKMIIEKPDIAS